MSGRVFKSFFIGQRFIRSHKLWKYVYLPSFLSLILGTLLFILVYRFADNLILSLTLSFVQWVYGLFDGSFTELHGAARVFIKLLAGLVAIVVNIILYVPLASVVVIPFMGPLLNQVERIHIGRTVDVTLGQDIRNAFIGMGVGVKIALINIFVLVITLPLGPFQILVNGPINGYFLGRSAFDYIFEKEIADLRERRRMRKEMRPHILGVGLAFFLIMLIPIIGPFIGPAAAVAGAALIYHPEGKPQLPSSDEKSPE